VKLIAFLEERFGVQLGDDEFDPDSLRDGRRDRDPRRVEARRKEELKPPWTSACRGAVRVQEVGLRLREEGARQRVRRAKDDARARQGRRLLPGGFDKCAEMGILAMPLPERYGGLGLDVTSCVVAMEALGYAADDQGLAFVVNTQLWTCELPILHFGSEAQKDAWLPRLARGEVIGGHATTEPGGGLRRDGPRDPGRAPRRALDLERHEDVHHERADRRPVDRLRLDGRTEARLRRRPDGVPRADVATGRTRGAAAEKARAPHGADGRGLFRRRRARRRRAPRQEGRGRGDLFVRDGVGAELPVRVSPRRDGAPARALHSVRA
jgi:hypothetical protein